MWKKIQIIANVAYSHFTVVCLVTWPLNANEAGGDLKTDLNSACLI